MVSFEFSWMGNLCFNGWAGGGGWLGACVQYLFYQYVHMCAGVMMLTDVCAPIFNFIVNLSLLNFILLFSTKSPETF